MTQQPGFRIGDDIYPIPTKYALGDTMLVEELCKIEFAEFAERLKALNRGDHDTKALVGLVACSVRQKHPTWSQDRVVRFVQNIDFEDFGSVGGEEGAGGEGEPGPAAGPEV